ncbi:MAG: flagellar hook-associated protein FlgK [Spirochaetaceae bacterium]|jgi:flagellar hook-associated protein 1 FlgK|nr:flagellar hook-associated protein FlgK [Spirochaetaceae bacterium]
MQSTFTGIEIGKRSMIGHSQGLQTIGHNLSNASTEGYSRQRVKLSSSDPLYFPQLNRENTPGQVGQGVDVASVERVRDDLLQNRVIAQGDQAGYWDTRDKYWLQVEQVFNEPDDISVRSLMDQFWEGWQELSVNPEDIPARRQVLTRGQSLIQGIQNQFKGLREIQTMVDDDLNVSVGQVNAILGDIKSLNEQIVKVKAMGDHPNDLLDKRDLLVEQLSKFMDITVDNRDADEFTIFNQGRHLIQGGEVHYLETRPDPQNEGFVNVYWKDSPEEVYMPGGKISSLLDLRDGDIREEIQSLDSMTVNFTDMVNDIHRNGWNERNETGIDFFKEQPFVNNIAGNYDRNGDGTEDSSWIFRINGRHQLDMEQQIGLAGTITLSGPQGNVEVNYLPADTVSMVMDRINSAGSEVKAMLDFQGRLTLKATTAADMDNPDFVLRHVEDSGQFLVGYSGLLENSGPDGAYDWEQTDAILAMQGGDTGYSVAPQGHPGRWMEINEELLHDPTAVTAGLSDNGRPAAHGDGSAALAIAGLRNNAVMVGPRRTFDDYFAETVARVGLKGEQAGQTSEAQQLVMSELKEMQQSVSGVNMDEEFAEMIKFQHGYNAAARFISTVDEMLDVIINRMGV